MVTDGIIPIHSYTFNSSKRVVENVCRNAMEARIK
jgi:hypothetical protein